MIGTIDLHQGRKGIEDLVGAMLEGLGGQNCILRGFDCV